MMGIGLGNKRHLSLMLLIVSSVIVLDQLTKWQITRLMRLHESLPVIPGLFTITYIRNSGAAFGILAGSHAGFRLLFFGLTTVLALALLDQALGSGAGEAGGVGTEENVEAFGGLARGDGHAARHRLTLPSLPRIEGWSEGSPPCA